MNESTVPTLQEKLSLNDFNRLGEVYECFKVSIMFAESGKIF